MNTLSVVIPSYKRAAVLLETIEQLRQQSRAPKQLIVVDQTDYAAGDPNFRALLSLQKRGQIKFIQRKTPSIPAAMNAGLLNADCEFVLFLDDDIRISRDFIAAHLEVLKTHECAAQVGQVLQPDQLPTSLQESNPDASGLGQDLAFPFNASYEAQIYNCMAGNLCVNRESAVAAGGFDENFIGAAYRFETEFCRRLIRFTGKPVHFTPLASIDHLQFSSGGTRSTGNYLTSRSPSHSAGDYYYALLEGQGIDRWRHIGARLLRSTAARFYLRRPWYIPNRLIAEVRGLKQAVGLYHTGPSRIKIKPQTSLPADGEGE
ncbi:MAG: glycosyltransferase family 2 protein [Gammaproteobacteria bacterium]|nr:glycosyltransferase family 2 protein [Gammaproteobacteria bacterium]